MPSSRLDRVKLVIGYLSKFKHGVNLIRTDKPDYSNVQLS